ncbi:unnamed protein product [Allacma fusca]|uniref:Gustatory receptor n=1 Tax=Allacma fusca TaxID=39272 RepID=A0A8J2LEM3_9HEXA|nr:unnamed protein product [Allacma fusca]
MYSTGMTLLCNMNALVVAKSWGLLHIFFLNVQSLALEVNINMKPYKSHLTKVVRLSALMYALGSIARASGGFKHPTTPDFLISLFELPPSLPLRILSGCFHLVVNFFLYYFGHFCATTALFYSMVMVEILKTLDTSSERSSGNADGLAERELRSRYIRLSLLQNTFNEIFSSWLYYFELCVIMLLANHLFHSVVYRTLRSIVVVTLCSLQAFYLFWGLGEMHEKSVGVLDSWQNCKGSPSFEKFRRACRPLTAKLKDFGFVDKFFLVTLGSVVIDTSADLILTYRYE